MKFLVDMPLSWKLAEFLREQGHDAFHIRERNMHRLPDQKIFDLAVKEQRIIITADLDFSRIFALYYRAGNPGMILFREGNLSDSQMKDFMERVLETITPDKIQNSIIVVEHNRIRVTPLPLK
jgi:predicted nuclease of predicted toxin-antitoxin system